MMRVAAIARVFSTVSFVSMLVILLVGFPVVLARWRSAISPSPVSVFPSIVSMLPSMAECIPGEYPRLARRSEASISAMPAVSMAAPGM